MANYELWVSSPTGERLALIEHWEALRLRRRVNAVGDLVVVVPADVVPLSYFQVDGRLEVWRDGRLVTETTWLIQYIAKRLLGPRVTSLVGGKESFEAFQRILRSSAWQASAGSERVIEVGAVSPVQLLSRRIVAYAAASSQAQKTGTADDLIKAVARENLGRSAAAGRDVSALLTIEADRGAGYSLSKGFAYRNVLTVCQELAAASEENGTAVFFDVVAPTPSTLELRTYTGQRGEDHSPGAAQPVILSPEAGTLEEAERAFDYSQEVTYVLAGGQGLQSDRLTASATDDARAGRSPFGRREVFRDARHLNDTTLIQAEADASLRRGQPARFFGGRVRSAPGQEYGVHWRWGDTVGAAFEGEVLTARIDAVTMTVDAIGEETLHAELQGEE